MKHLIYFFLRIFLLLLFTKPVERIIPARIKPMSAKWIKDCTGKDLIDISYNRIDGTIGSDGLHGTLRLTFV